ncbi:MAG: hypothetical protein KBE27_01035, partial [Syntrophorhabdaceae bacterium]|nr:hypothetical protein [Syntrophorhabdaceae bacterium]
RDMLVPVVKSLKERSKTLKDMASMATFYFLNEVEYDEKARDRFLTHETKYILEMFLDRFEGLHSLDEESEKKIIEDIVQETNRKVVDVIQPIRVALSGRTASPGIFEVINILGKETVVKRIKRAIDSIV